jgi:CRP-like cAMP-binding protein
MYEPLRKSMAEKVLFTDDEFDELVKYFTYRSIKKGDFLLKSGEVCVHGIFVLSGCLSYSIINQHDEEKIIDLGTEGWWMGDAHSFFSGHPSPYTIKALVDSKVLLNNASMALEAINKYHFYLKYHYLALLDYRDRTDILLTHSLHLQAEEKYKYLMETRPYLLQQIPLQFIASFIGVTPSSLSRIRRKYNANKL